MPATEQTEAWDERNLFYQLQIWDFCRYFLLLTYGPQTEFVIEMAQKLNKSTDPWLQGDIYSWKTFQVICICFVRIDLDDASAQMK